MSGLRILIADDDPMILRLMVRSIGRKMLDDRSIEFVETAGGVWEAFAAAKTAETAGMTCRHDSRSFGCVARPFDVVITDVDMMDGTGFELAELVATLSPRPRVIFMTAVLLQWKIDAAKKHDAPVYEKTNLTTMIDDLVKPLAKAVGSRK